MLIGAGAGADTIIQKATTGKVDWGQVAISGALGGFGGASVAAKVGLTGLKGTMVAGATSGGVGGAAQGAYGYMTGPGPHIVMGAVGATAMGGGAGALLEGAGGAVGHGIASKLGWLKHGDGSGAGGSPLGDLHPRPTGADLAINGPRLRAQFTAEQLSQGHASTKHVVDQGDFPGIQTRGQLAAHIEHVIIKGESRVPRSGFADEPRIKEAWWLNGTLVIRDERGLDGGTTFPESRHFF